MSSPSSALAKAFSSFQVLLGEGLGLGGEVVQEAEHLLRRVGHLGHQRDLGEVAVAEHARLFMAQREDAADQRAVVELRVAELGGAGGVGAVHACAQLAVVGVLQHRQVGGHLQGELPAFLAFRFGGGAGGLARILGDAGKASLVGDPLGVGVGGVEQVLGELGGELGLLFLDLLEARLLFVGQLGAGEAEVAQRVFEDALAHRRQGGELGAVVQRLVFSNSARFCPTSA